MCVQLTFFRQDGDDRNRGQGAGNTDGGTGHGLLGVPDQAETAGAEDKEDERVACPGACQP